ncbi:hypothetical protein GCM10010095_62170 [Streptomyces anthocyanicus]|nr:hypothetical protein GCM10010095_62170 [Streptomyces anthocyanicus]
MDVLGLIIAVVVLAANTYDNAAGIVLLGQVAEHAGATVRKALSSRTEGGLPGRGSSLSHPAATG